MYPAPPAGHGKAFRWDYCSSAPQFHSEEEIKHVSSYAGGGIGLDETIMESGIGHWGRELERYQSNASPTHLSHIWDLSLSPLDLFLCCVPISPLDPFPCLPRRLLTHLYNAFLITAYPSFPVNKSYRQKGLFLFPHPTDPTKRPNQVGGNIKRATTRVTHIEWSFLFVRSDRFTWMNSLVRRIPLIGTKWL